jgi:SAM-dependent methyltransferase
MATFDADAFNAFERSSWETVAGAYLDGFALLSAHTVEPLLDAVGAGAGMRLLDVGCGPGVLSSRGAARGCVVTGVDVAEPMVAIAQSAVAGAIFMQADVQAGLPFDDESFDVVASNMVVHHLADPVAAVGHMVRVLRPGGRLGMTMWDPAADNSSVGIFTDAVERAGAETPPGIPVLPARPDDDGLRALLSEAGLRDVTVSHVRFELRIDAARWWQAVISSTALTRAMVEPQPPDVQQRIRAAYDELAAGYSDDAGEAVFPASAAMAVGTRPT